MNIYELLKETIVIDNHGFSTKMFSDEHKEKLNTEEEKKIYDLLKNLCSISMNVKDDGVDFEPMIIFKDKRSFSIEDISEDDYASLTGLEIEMLPENIRARVADVLWTQKKDVKMANQAATAYLELFNILFCEEHWIEAIDMIKRAICISAQINKKELYEKCCNIIYNTIIKIDGKDEHFLSIKLIEILLAQSFGDFKAIIQVLDKILTLNKDNPNKMEQAYLLKAKCSNKLKDHVSAKKANIDMADYFLEFAEKIYSTEEQGALRAEHFFQKAIITYRNNGESNKGEEVHKRLVEVQKDKVKSLKSFEQSFDVSKIVENILQNMSGLSFEECIIRIAQFTHFYKKDEIKEAVFKDAQKFPFSHMFSKSVMNEDGQTVLILPPLSLSDPSANKELLDLHIHNKLLELQTITGDLYLRFALSYIKEHFDIQKEQLDFLIQNNAIIPEGRENIIRMAILLALEGRYYESVHILAPQAENIFRNIAREAGALTVTLEQDGSSKEKVLSSIFDLPELIDCYDNDVLFLFKGLLNEQAGANIRNKIAHGIMDEATASRGMCLFFICAVIKLLVISSTQCNIIASKNKKLEEFISIGEDDIDIGVQE